MDYILQADTLKEWLEQEKGLVIIDVRSHLKNPDGAEEAYKEAHIPHANYLHLERNLSSEVQEHGGNHPLPDIGAFADKLGNMGVTKEKPVIIYDAKNDMFAARAWWIFQYIGHEHTYVLDGGYDAWVEAGYEVTSELPNNVATTFIPNVAFEMKRDIEEVKGRSDQTVLIDSRAKARYLGETEPLYKKAGHIPGAKSYFWKNVLDENGKWKDVGALKENFRALQGAEEIIVSCGSGISACPNILALKQAGFKNVKLYPGSYSDWISYGENPVHQGEE